MRTKIIFLSFVLCAGIFSCDDDENTPVDPIYEFVAFAGESSVGLNELENSGEPFPLVAKILAFEPYAQDIDLSLEITGSNAQENTDFVVTPHDIVKIRAGKLVSDTIWIKTIDNTAGTDIERSFQIKIKSVSQPDVKIGLGLADPKNAAVTFNILDDECSLTTDIYNTTLSNSIGGLNGDGTKPAEGVLTGDKIKLTGDLLNYGPFSNASLSVTLTPAEAGSTKGKATFGEQETGTDADGYEYKFVEIGEGSYDVCSGTINIEYEVYYIDGGWTYWLTGTNSFSVP
ncbi:MAG TPA: hypothetical protein VFG46_12545 [Chryseolinea sp.]|nr:hypothetical protein [Chryseolinea sp.]